MADSVKLVIKCECDDAKEHDFSFKYADSETSASDVKALTEALITNGSIYTYVPVKVIGAKIVVTTENEYDLDD